MERNANTLHLLGIGPKTQRCKAVARPLLCGCSIVVRKYFGGVSLCPRNVRNETRAWHSDFWEPAGGSTHLVDSKRRPGVGLGLKDGRNDRQSRQSFGRLTDLSGERSAHLQTALVLLKLAWDEAKSPIFPHSLTLAALVCIELRVHVRVRATKALKYMYNMPRSTH